ncbi:POTRA domain-containing protein, partial [Pseudomaricurvus sp.]|uniref:POTRA domain-containing protein n=1 Tax=Pseudomaricurvus sp. TaxID=2004510 RepID=UPI003F6A9C5F
MFRPLFVLSLLLCASLAQAKLEVNVEPSNKAVEKNIEAFLGELDTDNLAELKQLYKHADQQATQAAQALGYYRSRNHIRIGGTDKKPVLNVDVDLGPPVTLNKVNIEILGAGKGTEAFLLPAVT